jgi:hypothetical protein
MSSWETDNESSPGNRIYWPLPRIGWIVEFVGVRGSGRDHGLSLARGRTQWDTIHRNHGPLADHPRVCVGTLQLHVEDQQWHDTQIIVFTEI